MATPHTTALPPHEFFERIDGTTNPTHATVELRDGGWLTVRLDAIAALGFDGDETFWLSVSSDERYLLPMDGALVLLDLLDMAGQIDDCRIGGAA